MPRKPRLDAPGALHHVIARGIEQREIFQSRDDYQDFLKRLEEITKNDQIQILAWTLIPNHFHLLVRSGNLSLSEAMRRLLTGYAVSFNKRHNRSGHLFQNRYKSILCEEEPYLLELVRYIHLNPLRAGLVKNLDELDNYHLSGHSALMGKRKRSWQETDEVLCQFSRKVRFSRKLYRAYVSEGVALDKKFELSGGGLLRSLGGWSEVKALKRRKEPIFSDTRVLGSGAYVQCVLKEAQTKEAETLRLKIKKVNLDELLNKVSRFYRIEPEELKSGSRRTKIIEARRTIAQLSIKKFGYSGAEVARHLGVTASCINRQINTGGIGAVEKEILEELETSKHTVHQRP